MSGNIRQNYISQRDNLELIQRGIEKLKSLVASSSVGGATEAEQQSQTALLTTIENNTDGIEALLTTISNSLSTLETIFNSANSPSQAQLSNPVAVTYAGFKELSFVCGGTISVTLDGNTIVYPFTLDGTPVLGSTIKADTISLNSVEFDGAGTVLVNIKQ